MQRHFLVTVDVDPSKIESNDPPDKVIADEIASNLDSVDYVNSFEVFPVTPPERGKTHVHRTRSR